MATPRQSAIETIETSSMLKGEMKGPATSHGWLVAQARGIETKRDEPRSRSAMGGAAARLLFLL
jgi:hypothetical protein